MKQLWVLVITAIFVPCVAVAHAASTDSGQGYPRKPVRVIVPASPGGGLDIMARMLGQSLFAVWGQAVVVDNRPGAGVMLGVEVAAKAAPDGYTALVVNANLASNAVMAQKLGVVNELQAVTMLATLPNALSVPGVSPAKTTSEFIALAKTSKLTFGTAGTGTLGHVFGDMLKLNIKADMIHVPYKGGGPALNDVIGGQVEMTFIGAPASMPHIRSGRLRILAVSTAKRVAALPEVPTVAESGYPGYDVGALYAVLAPAGTPAAIVGRLSTELAKIVAVRDIRERLTGLGLETVGGTPEQLTAFMTADVDKWIKLVQKIGLKTD